MAQRNRKIQKRRGSRNCGYGNTQKHRGAGSRGGRGMAGSKKHKWCWVSKYMPDHFGRSGFTRHQSIIIQSIIINVGDLEALSDRWVSEGKAKKSKDTLHVDLTALGYDKLLATGVVSKKYEITVAVCSKKAREKIEAAGGTLKTTEKPVEDKPKEPKQKGGN